MIRASSPLSWVLPIRICSAIRSRGSARLCNLILSGRSGAPPRLRPDAAAPGGASQSPHAGPRVRLFGGSIENGDEYVRNADGTLPIAEVVVLKTSGRCHPFEVEATAQSPVALARENSSRLFRTLPRSGRWTLILSFDDPGSHSWPAARDT